MTLTLWNPGWPRGGGGELGFLVSFNFNFEFWELLRSVALIFDACNIVLFFVSVVVAAAVDDDCKVQVSIIPDNST